MSSLKPVPSKESVSAWEILRKCQLFAFVFLALTYIATCESSSLFSTKNSSTIFSPLHPVFLTSTPNLSGVDYGQTLRSLPEQTSLETAIKSVNDGFISQFGVHTGDYGPGIHTSEALAYSRLTTNAPIVETTQGSFTVGEALQTENRNTQSTRGGVETHNLQTLQSTSDRSTMATILSTMGQSSYVQPNTVSRMASKMISTSDKSKMINTQAASSYSDFTPTGPSIISTAPTTLLKSSVKSKIAIFSRTSEPARVLSILSSHEKFTNLVSRLMSNLHVTSNVFSTDDLSPGKDRSKSTFLSHYSTGTTAQVQSIASVLPSTVRETSQVSPSFSSAAFPQNSSASSSTAVPRESSTSTSTTVIKHSSSSIFTPVHRDSSSSTSTAVPRVSTSFTSIAFDSYTKSASTTQHVHTTRTTTASSFIAVTRFTSVQPSFSSSVAMPEKAPLTCKVNNVTCVCFNCEKARKNEQTCCVDLFGENIQQGVKLNMRNVTVEGFYDKISTVSRVIAEVILDSCKMNSTLCFSNEKLPETAGMRKRRSPQTELLENDSSSSNIVRTKRDSDSRDPMSQTLSSSVNKEALRPVINPSKTNITRVDVIIYSISSKPGHPQNVQTAFYVTVTRFNNGTNQTQLVDGKGLLQILRDKKQTLENRLNITIDSFSAWQSNGSDTTNPTFLSTLVPNPSPGSQNLQTSLSTPQGRNLLQSGLRRL